MNVSHETKKGARKGQEEVLRGKGEYENIGREKLGRQKDGSEWGHKTHNNEKL